MKNAPISSDADAHAATAAETIAAMLVVLRPKMYARERRDRARSGFGLGLAHRFGFTDRLHEQGRLSGAAANETGKDGAAGVHPQRKAARD